MRENIITQYFEEVETTKEYNGYFCSVAEAITIVIPGSICGLKNISQIHIEEYVQDETLRKCMETAVTQEKNRGRIEKHTAFVTTNISWLAGREEWESLKCIGAVHTEFEEKGRKSSEWHYYISSRELTAGKLLHHARMEWCVETMHWPLDVHFGEDGCRVEDRNIQQNLNMPRKLTINLIKRHKAISGSKRAISKIMFDCLLDPSLICDIVEN